MPRTLAEWLAYQEHVNVHAIELGLDRIREVWRRMGSPAPARHVITVGGTNGKGSTVAMLEEMLIAAGLRVGSFTSPHLLVYNERVRRDAKLVDDTSLIASFERIEAARTRGPGEPIPLTYFEFGALAAFDVFSRADLDVAVLEVGLGGRLDAVNLIDADVAIITTIDLDHMDWLGTDRDSIGREKAGIARAGRPIILGEMSPPQGLLDALAECGAEVVRAGIDFQIQRRPQGWRWQHRDGSAMELPAPALAAPVQFANAAGAIAALNALRSHGLSLSSRDFFAAVRAGLWCVKAPARLQSLGGEPPLIVDVGHNPQAARALADWLDEQPPARVHAVYGALADKDVAGVIAALGGRIAHWHLAGLNGVTPRGMAAAALSDLIRQVLPEATFDQHPDVASALAAAGQSALPGERILAFGSFFVASEVLAEHAG